MTDTRTHNLAGQAAAGVRAARVRCQISGMWSVAYVVPTTAKPEIGMFADHANLPTRRLKEPSP